MRMLVLSSVVIIAVTGITAGFLNSNTVEHRCDFEVLSTTILESARQRDQLAAAVVAGHLTHAEAVAKITVMDSDRALVSGSDQDVAIQILDIRIRLILDAE